MLLVVFLEMTDPAPTPTLAPAQMSSAPLLSTTISSFRSTTSQETHTRIAFSSKMATSLSKILTTTDESQEPRSLVHTQKT
ncbi:hypothetical protein D6C83_09512 [Aureobasidium pullulans]|uniref:Uncharacterized protein n=1 Tax=Aureobasidium pullulans TaxID=5580 RepID=A0A4S9XRF6_AURPU|nr:hypothetical protein D6C83_09512 [Aureobasidium pullulans]